MIKTLAIWLFAAGIADARTVVPTFPIELHKPDRRALAAIKTVLSDQMQKMTPFPNGGTIILSSWVKPSDSAQPYLFVELVDTHAGPLT